MPVGYTVSGQLVTFEPAAGATRRTSVTAILRHLIVPFVAVAVLLTVDAAWACPMCKAAAEADPRLPRAFMASILFMLSMPFALTAVFGVAFYRLSKRMPKLDAESEPRPSGSGSDADPDSTIH